MLKGIIDYLNTLISASGYYDSVNGLVVVMRKTGTDPVETYPALYCGGGEFKRVSNFDTERGLCYWRLTGDIDSGLDTNIATVRPLNTRSYPLRLVCVVMRSQFEDNAYSEDKMSVAILKAITGYEKQIRQAIGAASVTITNTSVVVDPDSLVASELLKPELNVRGRMMFLALDFDIEVMYSKQCADDFCDDDVDIDAVIRANVITEITRNPAILTEEQTDSIEDVFCDGGGDATITINSISFGVAPSGQTTNYLVKNTDGDIVGEKIGDEWIVPSGGTPSPIDIDINSTPFLSGVTTNQDIPVENSANDDVGANDSGTWRIADSTINLEDTDENLKDTFTVGAETTTDYELGDTNVVVEDEDENPILEISYLAYSTNVLDLSALSECGAIIGMNSVVIIDEDEPSSPDEGDLWFQPA
jgi:hypothetical protein